MRPNKFRKGYSDKIAFTGVCLTFLLLATLLIFHAAIVNAKSVQMVDKQVEKAVLAENWMKAADLLGSVDAGDGQASPVLRLIKGHACLALNRNNESLCLFLSASSEDELKEWGKWAQDFVKRNPKSAIAHYFRGDALARLEQWDPALMTFDEADTLYPNHPLVLNARGVTYAAKRQLDEAFLDFYEATKANPSFADAYANRGARNIQKKDGAKGAKRAFNKALKISPDFALALHGRGCVKLVLNRIDEANKDFESAIENGVCSAKLLLENLLNIQAYTTGLTKKELLAMHSGEKPGTTFDVGFQDVKNAWDNYKAEVNHGWGFGPLKDFNRRHNFRRFDEKFGALDPVQRKGFLETIVGPDITNNDRLGKQYPRDLSISDNYHNRGHADKLTNMTQKTMEVIGSIGIAAAPLTKGTSLGVSAAAYSGGIALENVKQWTAQTGRGNRDQMEFLLQKRPFSGGVDSSLEEAIWDEGEWPFVPYYALLYQVKTRDIFLEPGEEEKDENVK